MFGWLPWQLVVANTLLLCFVLDVAIWKLVVRRARNGRRARWTFAAALVVEIAAAVGAIDSLAKPRRADRFLHWNPDESTKRIVFHFSWDETPILHFRVSMRQIGIGVLAKTEEFIFFPSAEPVETESAFIICRSPPLDVTEALDRLWTFRNADDTNETGRALWRVIAESKAARTNSDVAALVSRYRP